MGENSVHNVKFQIYARSKQDISTAIGKIEEFVNENITSKFVEHEDLGEIVNENMSKLKLLAKDNEVGIVCENESSVSIEGLTKNVMTANDKVAAMIHDYNIAKHEKLIKDNNETGMFCDQELLMPQERS